MSTQCKLCNKKLSDLNYYPHLNNKLFKAGIEACDIPQEILEDMPKSHLHVFYKCEDCKFMMALSDIPLMSDWELDNNLKDGKMITPERTVQYWRNWLEKNKK